MKSFYNILLKLTLLSLFIGLYSVAGFATNYYVSNAGNDANSGLSTSSPWKSLTKVNAANLMPGDQVLFQRGETFRGTLTVKSSGTSGNPITFGAYGSGENPVFSGFTTLGNWVNEGNGIYSTVVSCADNITNIVLVDGVNTGRGRYPNTGWLTYESHAGNSSITDTQLSATPNWTGAEVVIRKNRWMLDRNIISNHSGSSLTYTTATSWNPTDGFGYFIQNDIKTLDVLGEWYYNGTKFYMYFGSIVPTTKSVKISTDNMLLVLGYKNYITVENITFEGSNSHAIQNISGQNIIIQNCNFTNIGMTGIYVDASSSNASMTISGNTFNTSNNNAINLRGANTTANITNNTISNIGLIRGSATSIAVAYDDIYDAIDVSGANSIIEYNKISNVGHSAISVRVNTGIITRYNYVSNFGLTRYDAGGIYSWTVVDGASRTINNNIIIGSNKASEGIGGSTFLSLFGIYLDEDTQNCKVYNNTVSDVNDVGILSFNSRTATVRNNVSYNNGIQFQMSYEYSYGYDVTGMNVKKNFFVSKTNTQPAMVYKNDTSPLNLFGVADSNYYARPIDDNLTMQTGTGGAVTERTLSGWKSLTGQDVHSQKSPFVISSVNDLQFEFNATKTVRVVALSSPMIDFNGIKYSSSITLQPFTSIILMKDPNAVVVSVVAPSAPTSVVAKAGNGNATVTFAAPVSNGGSVITGYVVTSIPAGGIDINAGSTSMSHTITGLTNGTAYTFTVKATNSVGTSVASAPSNSVIPKADVATTFTFTGPSSGDVNSTSGIFTVTPSNPYTGTITITPSGTGSTGLSSKVLNFSNSSAAQTFTILPTVSGSITLTPSNNGGLTNPASLYYSVNVISSNTTTSVVPSAPTSVVARAGYGNATVTFAAPVSDGGSVITGYVVTSIPAGGIDINAGSTSMSHTITGLTNGTAYTFTVKATNSVGTSVASAPSNLVIPKSRYKNNRYLKSGQNLQVETDLTAGLLNDTEIDGNVVNIEVFPNPSVGQVNVRFSTQPQEGSRIEIFNMTGKKVASRLITGVYETINISDQASGIYFVKSILGENETIQKLILSK